jgi:hypothetical protein
LYCLVASHLLFSQLWVFSLVYWDVIRYCQVENYYISEGWVAFICSITLEAFDSTKVKVKVKCTLVQALRFCTGQTAHRGSRGIALPFLDHGTRRREGSLSCPGCSLLPGKTWYPLYRRLVGPQGRSGQVRKILPPPGFDPRTVQPIASHSTDYATRPTDSRNIKEKNINPFTWAN